MGRLTAALATLAAAIAPLAGCTSGEVDAELRLYLEQGNLDFYEDVVFPASRREALDGIFEQVPAYLPLQLPYVTDRVDAIITQRGDLQITSHLTAGTVYRKHHDPSALEYLEGEDWNGEGADERYGEALFGELKQPDDDYSALDEDLRLILLVNLPEPPGPDEAWSSDGWTYPLELVANYDEVVLDEQDQEHDIPEEEIQLMSRMIVGGELFDTLLGQRFDEELGEFYEDETANLVLEELTLPGEDGRQGHTSGSFDLTLEAGSFSASSGVATISGTFDADVRDDPWSATDPEVVEDLADVPVE